MKLKKGILIQGPISEWTKDIIITHQKNFPDAELLLSTWKNENVDNISCKVLQLESPKMSTPISMTVNHQKIGAIEGLKKMNADIIMKCRPDQYILNKKIFEIYEKKCSRDKIMIPNYTTVESIDYLASDFCQIATKKLLLEFWESIPFYDGSVPFTHAEIYLTMNYILNAKKDLSSWSECLQKYFYVKGFNEDFQIKWEKLENIKEPYQRWYKECYPSCVKPQQ